MSDVLQSDIFFFITSVAVIFITIAVLIILMYVVNILRDISKFFSALSKGTEELTQDMHQVRMKLQDSGVWTGFLLSIVTAVAGFSQRAKARKEKKKSN